MSTQIIAGFTYRDAHAAIDFLERAFGFERGLVVEGDGDRAVQHAELRLGDAWIMLGSPRDDEFATPTAASNVYVVLESPAAIDALHERAAAAGAKIVREPFDTDYGSRDFAAHDPEGNVWFFGTYGPGTDS
ncbi:MAG TPA: VOC family protein [Capillimicrobium sp.]|jgi:uncharacterized glyoxalase superfamily protein PhnB